MNDANVMDIAKAIYKTNKLMLSMRECMDYASDYPYHGSVRLPFLYNCPEGMIDVTSQFDVKHNPGFKYYMKGSDETCKTRL